MSSDVLAQVLGWLAVTLGFIGTVAQFNRVIRVGVEGISIATWTLFLWLSLFWISYGWVGAHSWQVAMGSGTLVPMQAFIYFRLAPWRKSREVLGATIFVFATVALPIVIWGWRGGVLGTSIAMTVTRLPQIIELIQTEDASGVSAASWWFGVVGCALWLFYYAPQHLWSAFIATLFAMTSNIVVVSLVIWRHQQARRRFIAEEVFISAEAPGNVH